ncbi:CBS-domain-containing membrane protein [Kribbella aluminosa]|uniref:CBS-domain-containing membrane protein n=1 Tax=Kribbella aluminosa TaxID=416017 RepID=A0ABS4UK82_9ACTN|nr:CBS domain-containing protein [Kribbella aluminosa]MBP2352062.1 CBS-domain-containing membrane protein [Kribbella aluminosa]
MENQFPGVTPFNRRLRGTPTVPAGTRKMRDLDVGALPICGEDNRLKGMLTDRDIGREVRRRRYGAVVRVCEQVPVPLHLVFPVPGHHNLFNASGLG